VGGELKQLGQTFKYFDAEEQDVSKRVIQWQPDFLCFSPMTTFYKQALGICREVKIAIPDVQSVFGGHHAMSSPNIIHDAGVDAVVVGPVRGTMEKILSGERGVILSTPTSPDDMVKPEREQYYREIPRMRRRYRKFMLSMLGCPWNCSYCSSSSSHIRNIFGKDAQKRYYLCRRPLETIIEEAREIIESETHEIEWVDDDVFAGPDIENWIPEFVAAWEKEIKVPIYVSSTSLNVTRVSDNALKTLKRIVNCIGIGVQAIRPESLKMFNRTWDSEASMKSAYDRLRSFGYAVNLQCIVGLPVDDPVNDALETIKGMQRIGPGSIVSCYPLMIYPGTKMEKYCIDNYIPLNDACSGDTNSGIPSILFSPDVVKRLRNICKLATMFVKYNVEERWMRTLIDIDIDEPTSRNLSMTRYYECIIDRLNEKGDKIFNDVIQTMKLRF
jgi:radical SAM superfamily enzyme YgiQ (UPF0313 family)